MKRSILRWELVGIIVISILGSVLHFVFEWSGNWAPVGVIAAVNESVWEHFKIAFWPALFYAHIRVPVFQTLHQQFYDGEGSRYLRYANCYCHYFLFIYGCYRPRNSNR